MTVYDILEIGIDIGTMEKHMGVSKIISNKRQLSLKAKNIRRYGTDGGLS